MGASDVPELDALSLAHFVVRALMVEAAQLLPLDPDRLSLTSCFRVLKCRPPECQPPTTHSFADWYAALIEELQDEQLPPAATAPPPHQPPRDQTQNVPMAQHKPPPRLIKPFADTIVMAN